MREQMRRQTGLTLLELVVSLLVMTILTSVAITSVSGIQEQARYEKTVRRLDEFKRAIVDDGDWSQGIRAYAFDMGTLPPNLRALISRDTQPTWRLVTVNAGTSAQFYMGFGWRGPYLYSSASPDDPDALRDSWGGVTNPTYDNNQYYGWVIPPIPLSSVTSMRIESYGSDHKDGPSDNCAAYEDDCLIDITTNDWRTPVPNITLQFLDTTTTTALSPVTTCLRLYYRAPTLGITSITSSNTASFSITSIPVARKLTFNFSLPTSSIAAGQNFIALFRCDASGNVTNVNNLYPNNHRPIPIDMQPGSTIPVVFW